MWPVLRARARDLKSCLAELASSGFLRGTLRAQAPGMAQRKTGSQKRSSVRATTLDADEASIVFSTAPDRAELAHFLSMLEEHDASLDVNTRSEVARWISRGAFSQAVEILDRLIERTPGNRSVRELRQLMQASALRLLRGRLGSRQRRVARASTADGRSVPPSFARFIELADARPRLGELLNAFGLEDLRAHEQVAALARGGFLQLGAPPPRVHDRGAASERSRLGTADSGERERTRRARAITRPG